MLGELEKTGTGLEIILQKPTTQIPDAVRSRLVQQSSRIGPYPFAKDLLGSSYLWIGANHHLDRQEVQQLMFRLEKWLRSGSLDFQAQDVLFEAPIP